MSHGRPSSWRARAAALVSRVGLVMLALVLLTATSCRKRDSRPTAGDPAPPIALSTLDHGRFYLRDALGKPVVLVFWDTSCEICKRELRELETMRKALGPERVTVAGVCQDPENIDLARALVSGLDLGFPTLLDEEGRVTRSYGVEAFPTTVVVAPEGEIGFVREGYTEPLMRQLRAVVEGYLEASRHGR